MNFAVGDRLLVDGEVCSVVGKISYRNIHDNSMWMEYRLISQESRREKWLSYDENFREYSVSEIVSLASTEGYHQVDQGVEEVIGAWGDVDVEIGDKADFVEFEDDTEEKIISWETWEDGKEVSAGYYLDFDEIERVGQDGGDPYVRSGAYQSGGSQCGGGRRNGAKGGQKAAVVVFRLMFIVCAILSVIPIFSVSSKSNISDYLGSSASYAYVTSITGAQNEKADVYQTVGNIDWAVMDIIDAIEGRNVDVQQNIEEGDESVAILTDGEYCLVYTSEDGDTLVQVSTRKYAYYNDDDPYRSRSGTRRYYRSFYFSRGYNVDTLNYGGGASPYSNYTGDTVENRNDVYSSYADSVRRSSVNSRTSSGGGTSSGK